MTVIRRHLNPAPAGMAHTPIVARDGRTPVPTPRENSRAHNRPARPKMVRRPRSVMTRASTLTLRYSLHSVLKEFFNPLRAGNPRADFFAVYHKESSEFDRDYAGRLDGDLNTALIFVSRPIFDVVTGNRTQRYPVRSVLRSQCNIRRQCPTKTRTRSERCYRRLRANPPPRYEQHPLPWCGPQLCHLGRPSPRNCHRPVIALRKSRDLTLRRVSRNARKAVGQQLPQEPRRLCC